MSRTLRSVNVRCFIVDELPLQSPHNTPAAQEKFDAQLGALAGRLAMRLLTFAAVVPAMRMIAFLPLPLELSAIVPGVDAGHHTRGRA
ncbi:MAG: hypothetical protein WA376_08970 [Terrimicrobiaceae bacterium]